MKNQKITSILGSILMVSCALIPVSAVFADDSTSTATTTDTTVVATSTDVATSTVVVAPVTIVVATSTATSTEKNGFGRIMNMHFPKMPPFFSSSTFKKVVKADFKKASTTRGPDWKDASSTASSTRALAAQKNQERKDAQIKKNIDTITQNLSKIADKLGTLGTQIKAIVNGQASSSDVIANAVNNVDKRGAFQTFLFGSDYKNLGTIISQVNIMQMGINQLNNQISKLASSTDKTALVANVQSLKDQIATLEQYVKDNINKFSLFGWFVQKLNK